MKKIVRIFMLCLLISCWISPVFAATDKRPPHIDIVINNAPDQFYYLDLLVDDGETLRFRELREVNYNSQMLRTLESLVPEGMHTALWQGTHQKMFGDLVGVKQEDGSMLHSLDGYGVPDRFKLLFVFEDGTTRVSDWYDYEMFIGKVFVDYETLEIKTRPFELFYIYHYLLLVIPYALIKMISYISTKLIPRTKKSIFLCTLAILLEIAVVTPIMSYGTIYNGSLRQAAMVLMFGQMVYTFAEYYYAVYFLKNSNLKGMTVTFLANIIASIVLIQLLQYEFTIFLY
ncbi:MAG: hypothetical protein IJP28_03810 [Erysipelotrichales bacterium]|nr:hypothetical protein [Erysipelotrichales bacterium]